MADTGFKNPAATGDDHNQWSDAINAYTSDDGYAWDVGDGTSQDYYNFTFGVPAGATINGIEISVEGYAATAGTAEIEVELSYDGGANYTSAATRQTWTATTESSKTFGGAASLFGRAWSDGEFSNANFRARITEILTDNVFALDHIKVKVYYTEAPATYALTVTAGAGGTASDETGTSPYEENAIVDILATPNGGYSFNNWTTSDGGTFDDANAADTNYNMPGNVTEITANFTADAAAQTTQGGGSISHEFKRFPELTNNQITKYYWDSPHKQIMEGFMARVIKVTDGDTIKVRCDFRDFDFPIRFAGTEAPEMSEEGGLESKAWLSEKILGEEVYIKINPSNRIEKWGRLLGEVFHIGMNINQMSINEGKALVWEG